MIMAHGAYIARIGLDAEEDTFHGEVLNLRDVITFQGRSVAELRRAFSASVADYLAFCRENGREPERPFSGKFMVRVDPGLHREAVALAAQRNASLNAIVATAIREYVVARSGPRDHPPVAAGSSRRARR